MSTTDTKGTALITGASSGMGAIYADRLAKATRPADTTSGLRNQPEHDATRFVESTAR
jgi:NAD(P)-dependent dehydrogenase (short-subunit alcohol dehydrogenase family)